jgi:hypothetical protein
VILINYNIKSPLTLRIKDFFLFSWDVVASATVGWFFVRCKNEIRRYYRNKGRRSKVKQGIASKILATIIQKVTAIICNDRRKNKQPLSTSIPFLCEPFHPLPENNDRGTYPINLISLGGGGTKLQNNQ